MAEPAVAAATNTSQPSSPTPSEKQQQPQSQPEDEAIPPLNCISAAMFVPIAPETTLLTPFPTPSTDRQRAAAALAAIDAHEAHVRNNLQALFRREFLRLTRDAEAQEAEFQYPDPDLEGGDPALVEPAQRLDVAAMVVNMAAPDEPSVEYNLLEIPVPGFNDVLVSSPREWASNELMKAISAAATNLYGFDKHVASMRDAVLRKEEDNEVE